MRAMERILLTVHEQRLEELSCEEARHKEAHAVTENAIHAHRRAMERILLTVSSVASSSPHSEPARIHMPGSDSMRSADVAMPELLVQLRRQLDASFLHAQGSAEHVEHQ